MKLKYPLLFALSLLILFLYRPAQAAPSPEHFTYYEADNFFSTSADPTCNSDAHTALIDMINRAHTSLEVAAYAIGCESIVDSLILAQDRGVSVRVVSETDNATPGRYGATIGRLADAGVPVLFDDASGLMHNKFVIRDEIEVWMGGGNFTPNGFTLHINHWIHFYSGCIAGLFFQEFDELWEGDFGVNEPTYDGLCVMDNGAEVEVYFSPSDRTERAIIDVIDNAQETVRCMLFYFTSDPLGDALLLAGADDVDVRCILDRLGGTNRASEDERLCADDIAVTTWERPGLLHTKSLVVDAYGDSPVVVLGSHNWTASAEERNQESTVIVRGDRVLARKVRALFNTLEFLTPDEWTCDGQDGDYSLPLRSAPVSVDVCEGHTCPSVWEWLYRAMCGSGFDCYTRIHHDGQEWGTYENGLDVPADDGVWEFCGLDGCNVITIDEGEIVKQGYEVYQR